MVNVSNFITRMPLNNQPCMTRLTPIDLNLGNFNQGLSYYPFMVNLSQFIGTCNTLDGPSGRV